VVAGKPFALAPGAIGLCDAGVPWVGQSRRHEPTVEGGRAQLAALDAAARVAVAGHVRALVTAPMSKTAVHLAGYDFIGHTEHLARAAGLADDDVTMMFIGPRLRVALATTHLSIANVPAAVTEARVRRAIEHLAQALLRLQPPSKGAPSIVVTGLNPHAGEAGLFGNDEARAIVPAIKNAAAREPFVDGRVRLRGPTGAETAFRQAASGAVDGVVAMIHDQATIASKLLDWTFAVNVTWGLPFVRTSVDHGVAYDAAASNSADAQGMMSAITMAQQLTQPRSP
jgi:4-hydroxythreonine-4-phosphate dehydrogenase